MQTLVLNNIVEEFSVVAVLHDQVQLSLGLNDLAG
jgi:hypothetical protein